jgi:nitrogen fixation protein NifT
MANIMIRQNAAGGLVFYLPKRDLEASIESLEFDTPEKWGGELKLDNGGSYYIDPIPRPERLPVSVRAKRLGAAED